MAKHKPVHAALRSRLAALLAVAALWGAVYVAAAWPRLRGPLTVKVLLEYGALPVPLPAGQWPRLFSTWLVHVDWLHLVGNVAAWGMIWLPWPQRDAVGWRLGLFVACGLGASLASVCVSGPAAQVSAGPSGAIVGVLIAAAVERGPVGWYRGIFILAAAALLLGGALTGGDSAAHAGGALSGLLLGLLLRGLGPQRHAP